MSMQGAKQKDLNHLCLSVFDELGLPDHDVIEKLEHFLENNHLKDVNLDEILNSKIRDLSTIFGVMKALFNHGYYTSLMIVCRKFPERFDFEYLDADMYVKLNKLKKSYKTEAPKEISEKKRSAKTKAPENYSNNELRTLIYNTISKQIEGALMEVYEKDSLHFSAKKSVGKKR